MSDTIYILFYGELIVYYECELSNDYIVIYVDIETGKYLQTGLTIINQTNNGLITANTTHLTSFAVA